MFKKILIANRGEIARRIIRTCKRLNIQTVAVYSEADKDSLFVREADKAYEIGKPPVALSYLNIDKIIETAKKANAEAIHPGYGLLSENPNFAKRCEEEGIVFIGPKPDVIAAMGSKLEARIKMKEAGVPIIEGVNVAIESVEEALKEAEQIGYPLMLKASSGGGGIGMQRIHNQEELAKAFEGNKKRAQSYFGDGTMYIEKYIENPHHVEVQILADAHGNVVPLFERECSIQRRNQKVIEEAPSPTISDATREKMLEAAVRAAKYIGYTNAGTFEFLVDDKENFYFLEMNTRLQVEHPVTEEITGIDLVEQQIRIAQGLPLEIARESLKINGHAIEARIYAEDPVTFYPSPGVIGSLQLPEGEGVRNDCAVESGAQVTPFYDPMIGKLIVHGKTREEAVKRLVEALKLYKVEGIKTNIPMLLKIASHEQFIKGNITTSFVERYYLPEVQVTK
ncbi:acetyl-CoA carboxylase biotin carboxylase subunit [Ureibacillus sp. FSL K6-8385]|uniref:acetyl-CoA carboxylase biotin carboxylase subunit n=1 Tax=Ureibacillus TaxID=160795 RepID=UPI002E1AD0AA|nr:acetyl-CoA carboxylase biotin carboxylase subunit [Ureibacillus terrenus]MED3764529.1 acetyl-CoA carboxylase biotin carboxylase subunit [Ureibacillus terrenus]